MIFVPEAVPVPHAGGPAYWFVFRREELLVCLENGLAVIPYTACNPVPEYAMIRKIYLVRLDGSPCYAVEVSGSRKRVAMTMAQVMRLYPELLCKEELY